MVKTRQLKSLLDQYKNTLEQSQYESFEKEVESQLKKYSAYLGTFRPGVERGREVQRLVDKEVENSSHIQTSCKKGCGFCCHYEVEITTDDAAVLIDSLKNKPSMNLTHLEDQAQRVRLDQKWKKGMASSNRCIFLGDDDACTNYENRPAICRKVAVTSPASECAKVDGNPQLKLMPMAEIILSAALSQSGVLFSTISKMLLETLQPSRVRDLD